MTVITHPRRKSNLAMMIDSAGGVSVGVALAQARANIESMRGQALTVIEAGISALEAVPAPSAPEEAPARLDEAYRAATTLIDAAGPFELFDLCRAATGLCDLLGPINPDFWSVVLPQVETNIDEWEGANYDMISTIDGSHNRPASL